MGKGEETVRAPDAPDDSTNLHDLHGAAGHRCVEWVRRFVRWWRFAVLSDFSVCRRHDAADLRMIQCERPQQVVMLGALFCKHLLGEGQPTIGI